MYRSIAILILVLMGITVSAQTINISGKVTNNAGKGISGATIKLASRNLSVSSDASGNYALQSTFAAPHVSLFHQSIPAIIVRNGMLTVSLTKPDAIQIELFNVQGDLVKKVTGNLISAGNYQFDLTRNSAALNVMMIRVTTGQYSSIIRYLPLNNVMSTNMRSVQSGRYLSAAVQAVTDSLQVSASGYTAKNMRITSYETTVDITLDTLICKATPSKPANTTVSGSGPHKVTIETNSDPGIKSGTIYRPTDLGPGKKYPIFVWGEGACAQDGYSNKAAMGEIASWGYFIVADGSSAGGGGTADAMIAYIKWAIAENRNPCSAYYQSLDTTKIAADGFSCGGLMAENASYDPRFTAIGITSSGLFNADANVYKKIHTPFKIMNGGPNVNGGGDMAYNNGLRDYNEISALGKPIVYFSKTSAGHGGDLGNPKGDFNTVNLAWLNWQLKGDTTATGKALLIGPNCKFCKASGWDFKSANLP